MLTSKFHLLLVVARDVGNVWRIISLPHNKHHLIYKFEFVKTCAESNRHLF